MGTINVNKILDFLKQLGPIVALLEAFIPGIREKIEEIREGVEREGAEFINRNLHVFRALVTIGTVCMDIGSAVRLIGTMAPMYAEDDQLDLSELESLGRMLGMGVESSTKTKLLAAAKRDLYDIR